MTAPRSSRRGKAHDRLRRILYLLPAASGPDGARIDDLCDALEVTRQVLLADLAEVTAREYYLRAGAGDGVRLMIDAERVRVHTTGEFRRPPRLEPREALALVLGLRVLAAERDGVDRDGVMDLARRLEDGLASVPEIEFAPDIALGGAAGRGGGGDASASGGDGSGETPPVAETRRLVTEAARRGRRCAFRYLKPAARRPEPRSVEPYELIFANGRWYTIGQDPRRGEVRVFRLDRMTDARLLDVPFARPPDFDLDRWLTGGHVYRAPDGGAPRDARIRYSRRIARWIVERGEAEAAGDGDAYAERQVADPAWVVRHVLGYGGDAELLGPAELRTRVTNGARRAERAHA